MPTIVGILTFISGKNSILGLSEQKKSRISRYFYTYEHLKFRAQMSWAWKKFYNIGYSCLETYQSCCKSLDLVVWIQRGNLDERSCSVGGKKGNRTEPNRTNGLYRAEPTEISDCCGTGFYLHHRTEPTNAIFTAYFIIISFSIILNYLFTLFSRINWIKLLLLLLLLSACKCWL